MHTPSDVLVLGAGIAGCSAALKAASLGAEVVLVTKDVLGETATSWAQGGIIGEFEDDSPELLARDITNAGAGLCRPEAVERLAVQGPALVRSFLWEELRTPFDLDENGHPSATKEAAHSARRIYHAKDATGKAIQESLDTAVRNHPRIRILEAQHLVDLITSPHHSLNPLQVYEPITVHGAYLFDCREGVVHPQLAQATILATGGLGYLYLHTTNPRSATGDGLAAAFRASARIVNCEYVQFHPTAFYAPGKARRLLTEALRGEGAHLVNRRGERFMGKYAPEKMELAPRDVVSRAIFQEMALSGEPCVFLDLKPVAERLDLDGHFPNIMALARSEGLEPPRHPLPVVPAAHYFCGGVLVDLEGRTTLRGLWAAGEVACTGLHGANRLASASLLEGLYWGHVAAETAVKELRGWPPEGEIRPWQPPQKPIDVDPLLIEQDWNLIRSTLWNYAGIVRSHDRLRRAKSDLGYLHHRLERFYRESRLTRELIELRSGIICARLILNAALQNPESRGCHYRIN